MNLERALGFSNVLKGVVQEHAQSDDPSLLVYLEYAWLEHALKWLESSFRDMREEDKLTDAEKKLLIDTLGAINIVEPNNLAEERTAERDVDINSAISLVRSRMEHLKLKEPRVAR